jgi:RNA recognition motif-containing protein
MESRILVKRFAYVSGKLWELSDRRGAMPVRLFVGNLPYETTEAEIKEHFSAVASPSYVYLPTDRESGRPRGFAFVEFDNQTQADEAIRRFNNQLFKGRPLAVNEARARENGPGPRRNAPAASPPRTKGPDRPVVADQPGRGGPTGRQFGPDAPPRRNRKRTNRPMDSERAPKRPMRERVRGRFVAGDVDDVDEDEFEEDNA